MNDVNIFQDTTILFDRLVERIDPRRAIGIAAILNGRRLVACTYSRLELKRALLQNLALFVRYLAETRSITGALELVGNLQYDRGTIFGIARWVMRTADATVTVRRGDSVDRRWAIEAESVARNLLRTLWYEFDKLAVAFTDRTECMRAREAPIIRTDGSVNLTIHESQCKDRSCNNADYFRTQLPLIRKLVKRLQSHAESGRTPHLSAQMQTALSELAAAITNPDSLYDYSRCARLGDFWIHLECVTAKIQDIATRNYHDSQHLCPPFGLNLVQPAESAKQN